MTRPMTQPGCIAVLNAGSSSIKFALYEAGRDGALLFRGQVERLGTRAAPAGDQRRRRQRGGTGPGPPAASTIAAPPTRSSRWDASCWPDGRCWRSAIAWSMAAWTSPQPARIDADVLAKLARLVPLAPLHQPHNLAPIEAIAAAAPHIPQVACFDTAFHRSQPHVAGLRTAARVRSDAGVRRYGFHGLLYDYIVSRLRETAPEIALSRQIIAHLGNGASLCALQDWTSVATTMGFTALEGLIMGTRTGSLDPGILLYLLQSATSTPTALRTCFTAARGCSASPGSRPTCAPCGSPRHPRQPRPSPCSLSGDSRTQARWRLRWEASTPSSSRRYRRARAALRDELATGCPWLGLDLDDTQPPSAGPHQPGGSRISAWSRPPTRSG